MCWQVLISLDKNSETNLIKLGDEGFHHFTALCLYSIDKYAAIGIEKTQLNGIRVQKND